MTRASSGVHHRGGIVAKGVEYELNVLILATGFLLALGENAAPAKLFGIPAAGCSGRYLKDKHGYLHGIATNSLPNVIYLGLGGRSGSLDLTAVNRVPNLTQLIIKLTKEANDAKVDKVESRAAWYSVLLACTSGYFDHEGAELVYASSDLEKQRQAMRRISHGRGKAMYNRFIREHHPKD
ncbi:hypothetical protein COCHEDRAFT_1195388 [Bipolaris maydis C5]|uniref:Uncharacterized protein n=1 Tax=Cochliobolus heterostrophus (strain C5 / ATCC 48332 / race O) TaxID=701091 RepID=M2U8L4_COCH5|nr:hypothetical protein COCHEDRAFT_1195388 [Bipolaris maydis C5]KAJ6207937.1 hypothetical protein PSV09DRAFT_1195388 [Bipolaris maydis]